MQPCTKTAQKSTLGGGKKFLLEDSECMCATGGKVTIIQHAQIDSAGSVMETFKNIAMMIPGAMLGNDKAPKVVESYWMDEAEKERIDEVRYGEAAQLFVRTENVDEGHSISIHMKEKNGQKIDGKVSSKPFTGTVKADGTAQLKPLHTEKNWNKTQE